MKKPYTNIVSKSKLREIQKNVLNTLSDCIMNSIGPKGSNSMITYGSNRFSEYTKDGHTILGQIKFMDTIENKIVEELHQLTAYIDKTVGDGTSSVIVIGNMIFNELLKVEDDHLPYEIVEDFQAVANDLINKIKQNGKEPTVDDIYKIAMISSNSNSKIAYDIKDIYERSGMGVYINVGFSNTENTIIKTYDGLTINRGYLSGSFINNLKNNTCTIKKPKIYAFRDAVIVPELISYFDAIIYNNIIKPMSDKEGNTPIIPTVIFCPSISVDLSHTINYVEKLMLTYSSSQQDSLKPPLLIVTDLIEDVQYKDIMELCDAKMIINYINPDAQKRDIEAGVAPSIETICDWCGEADMIVSTKDDTKIINPKLMVERNEDSSVKTDENGSPIYTEFFSSKLDLLNRELESLKTNNASLSKIVEARRRLNNLKANMVDYLIGGISTSDRDGIKRSAEDAVKNCSSAATYGYGYAANFETILALENTHIYETKHTYIIDIINNAYTNWLEKLYSTRMTEEAAKNEVITSKKNHMPINLKHLEYDNNVLSSIASDQVILECIAKIITIMFTSNQAIVPTPIDNVYIYDED